MRLKLIKTEKDNFILIVPTKGVYDKDYLIGSSREGDIFKLSLENCQAIELGYDLCDLASDYTNSKSYGTKETYDAVVYGFQKCLEILGDKKFSEEDMMRAMTSMIDQELFFGETFEETKQMRLKYIDGYMKSLQPEWDVEYETDEIDTSNVKEGKLNYDNSGRAYPDNPNIKKNWSAIWKNDGKFYKIVNLPNHGEWEEISGVPKLDADGHPILKRQI